MRGTLSTALRLGVVILSLTLALAPHAFADTTYGTPRLLPFTNLLFPRGLTVDRNGYVIVADGVWRNFVVDLSPAGVQRTIPPFWYDDINQRDVAVDANNYLYVTTAQGLFRTTPDRSSTTQLKPFPAYAPFRIALDGLGNIYAIDGGNWHVAKIDLATLGASYVAFPALLPGYAGGGPDGLAADAAGNVFVSDTYNNRILEWSPGGVGVRTLLDNTTVSLPRGLALDAAGNLIIADSGNGRVLKRTPDGTVTTLPVPVSSWSGAYQGDVGGVISVAFDAAGCVYALEQGASRVSEICPASPQSITFTSTAPADAAIGGTYVVAATGGGSGNPVTFSIDAASAGSCSLSGSTVSFAHAGTCVIDANQAGSFTFSPAPQAQQSFSIAKGTPTVTWNQPAGIVYGTPLDSTQLNATASVGGSFTYTPSAGTILAPGTQTLSVQFTPTDAANWNSASANTTIDVSKAPQSISFTSDPTGAAVGRTYVVAATGGGSGNPVTFSIDAASAGSCSLSGTTVSFALAGTCVIDANQAGSSTYAPAPQAQQSFSAGKGTPTVTWNQPAGIVYGTPLGSTQLNATASLAGSFAYTPPAGTILAAGTRTLSVQFTPTDAANWNGASANTTIDVSKAPQIISFTSDPTGAAVGRTYGVAATGGGSTSPVVFSIDPATTPGACTIAGSVVTYVTAGTCVIDANQAGDANYFAAPQAQQSFVIVNTGSGSNVPVTPTDTTTGAPAPINLNFSNVTSGGTSSVTSTTTGPPPPTGFKLGTPPTYYDVSTTATFSGSIRVCINYASVSYNNPSSLRLFHNANGTWVDITTSNDIVAKVICGNTPSLSPFVLFESQYAATVQSPIAANGSSLFQANRGSIPVKFTATFDGASTCALPPAQIAVTRLSGSAPGVINADVYSMPSDDGPNFRISSCQYVYNLSASALGAGTYRADIIIQGATVGSATFGLK